MSNVTRLSDLACKLSDEHADVLHAKIVDSIIEMGDVLTLDAVLGVLERVKIYLYMAQFDDSIILELDE